MCVLHWLPTRRQCELDQLLMEWPTPGLCPGDVGLKSSTSYWKRLVADLLTWTPELVLPKWPLLLFTLCLCWPCLWNSLDNSDLICLPSTSTTRDCNTKSTARIAKKILVKFAMVMEWSKGEKGGKLNQKINNN